MWEEASASDRRKHVKFLNPSRETPLGAVCRTDRSTGEGLTKYYNSYLYRDIYKVPYCLKNFCTTQLYITSQLIVK